MNHRCFPTGWMEGLIFMKHTQLKTVNTWLLDHWNPNFIISYSKAWT